MCLDYASSTTMICSAINIRCRMQIIFPSWFWSTVYVFLVSDVHVTL